MLEVVSKLLVSKRPVSASVSESSNPPGIAPKHEVLSGVIQSNRKMFLSTFLRTSTVLNMVVRNPRVLVKKV